MEMHSLRELYVENLRDMYSAETQLVKALPRMIQGADNADLVGALDAHLTETEAQVARLERIFAGLGERPQGRKCKGIEGLIEEGAQVLAEQAAPDVVDAGIIVAAQKVEHYEIAVYGALQAFAEMLDDEEAAGLLAESLAEEKEADARLAEIALAMVNLEAAEGAETANAPASTRASRR